VLGEVTFSRAFGFIENGRDIGGAIANTRFLGLYIAVIGHFYFLHDYLLANPLINKFNLAPSNHIFDTAMAAVEVRKRNPDARKDMMEHWLRTRREYPDRMEEKELLAGSVVNVGAGADTISTTLQSFFYHLLRNSKAMAKARAEVDAAADREELSDVVSYAQAQKLTYLQACVSLSFVFLFPPAETLTSSIDQRDISHLSSCSVWSSSCGTKRGRYHLWPIFPRGRKEMPNFL
jgi:hypothetical protein